MRCVASIGMVMGGGLLVSVVLRGGGVGFVMVLRGASVAAVVCSARMLRWRVKSERIRRRMGLR